MSNLVHLAVCPPIGFFVTFRWRNRHLRIGNWCVWVCYAAFIPASVAPSSNRIKWPQPFTSSVKCSRNCSNPTQVFSFDNNKIFHWGKLETVNTYNFDFEGMGGVFRNSGQQRSGQNCSSCLARREPIAQFIRDQGNFLNNRAICVLLSNKTCSETRFTFF